MEYKGFSPPKIHGNVTKFTPHMALKLIVWGMLNFDGRVIFHCVVYGPMFRVKGFRVQGVRVKDVRV